MYNSTRSFQLLLCIVMAVFISVQSLASASSMPGDGSVNIPASGSLSLPCGSSLTLYDDGGPLGAYSVSSAGWLILENSGASIIHLIGTYAFECGYDNVTIWDGDTPGASYGIESFSCGGTIDFQSLPGQTISISTYGDGSLSLEGFEWNLFYAGECGVVNLPPAFGYSLQCGNGFNLYDDGGVEGNYTANQISFLELNNSGWGVAEISGSFDLGSGDSLVIYHGNLSAMEHIASYTGAGNLLYNSLPGMDLILYFYADDTDESAGLDLLISYSGDCYCGDDDLTPPYAINFPSVVYANTDGSCGAIVNWDAPTFYDNCSELTINSTATSGSYFSYPGATVDYTVIDEAGNTTVLSLDIIIEDVDNPTVIFYETTVTSSNNQGECGANIFWTDAFVSDNCSFTIDTIWSTHNPGDFFNVGWDTVTTYVADLAGNIGSSQLYIHVIDTEYPEIICPANMTVCEGIPINYALPEVQDNCGALLYQTAGLPTGSVFPAGTITNGFAAADDNGNIQTCLFTITANPQPVVTLIAPEDTLCVQDISMTLDGQPAGGIYAGPGLDGATIIAEDAGIGNLLYTYEFTNEFGCTNSTKIGIVVDDCIGIEELGSVFSAGIYPNPADGNFFVNLPDACNLLIYDAAGQLVRSTFLPKGAHRLDVSELATGTYMVRVVEQNSGASATKKLVLN